MSQENAASVAFSWDMFLKECERIEGERPLRQTSAKRAAQHVSTVSLGEQPRAPIRHGRGQCMIACANESRSGPHVPVKRLVGM
jgi:hypothetical protein